MQMIFEEDPYRNPFQTRRLNKQQIPVMHYSVSSKMGSPSSFIRSKRVFINTEEDDDVQAIPL